MFKILLKYKTFGHVRSDNKFGPDRSSHFDVYRKQTDGQTDRHDMDRQATYV